jgi:hypothetical protein
MEQKTMLSTMFSSSSGRFDEQEKAMNANNRMNNDFTLPMMIMFPFRFISSGFALVYSGKDCFIFTE